MRLLVTGVTGGQPSIPDALRGTLGVHVRHHFQKPLREPFTRRSHRLHQIFRGPGRHRRRQFRSEPPAFSIHYVARPARRRAVKQFFPPRRVSIDTARLFLHAPDVRDRLPDLFIRHTDADAPRRRRRHGRACNSVVNVTKNLFVRISVPLLRARQIRSPPAATRRQSMAERAVRAKLRFAQLRCLRVAGG